MTTLGSHHNRTIDTLRETVQRVRSQTRRVLVIRSLGRLIAVVGLGLVLLVLIDFLLRLPAPLRWVLLVSSALGLIELMKRWLIPAWRFGPTQTDVALRLEHAAGSAWHGRLASGLELASARDPNPEADAIRAAAVATAVYGFEPALVTHAVDRAIARRWLLGAMGTLVLCGTLGWFQPAVARTGLERVLTPWTDAKWPRRQVVAHVDSPSVLPIDRAVPIRAEIQRTNRAEGETPVWASYRLVVGGEARPWQRVRLTAQGAGMARVGLEGELYERLIEPGVTEQDRGTLVLEYRLETEDDRSGRRSVRLVQPPRVISGELTVTLPVYAEGLESAGEFVSGTIELGDGSDSRGVVTPVLAGSSVRVRVMFNKSVPITSIASLATGFDVDGKLSIVPDADGLGVSLTGVLDSPVLLPLVLVDKHGITTRGEPLYRVEVIEDHAPTVAVIEPARDEQVLASAVLPLIGQAEDDLGLGTIWLVGEVHPIDSESGAGELVLQQSTPSGQTLGEVAATLDLGPMGLHPGDEIRITAVATDVYAGSNNQTHGEVRSRPRRLRVISETTLIDQVRAELGGVRRAAMRLDEEQAQVESNTRDRDQGVRPAELAQSQDALARRLDQQLDATTQLIERLDRNGLDNPALQELLEQSEEILEAATEAADEAAEQLARDDREGAEEQQREVRDEISRLVGLLDRGEDSWLARQGLERLLDEQREIQQQTAEMQEQTLGRELDELSEDERSDLQKIADRQRAAADRAAQAIDELADAADRLQDRDAAQAAALEQAAASARRARLPDRLGQAADQIGENQTQQAQQQQQQAIEDLENAIKQLDEGEKIRDETLRRVLASLVESLKILVDDQLVELTRLDLVDDVAGLDAAMIGINQRTIAAEAQSASGGAELAVVTDRLGRAGKAQARAVSALRADGAKADRVRGFEQTSLDHLEAALEEAEQAEEQAEDRAAERERAELRQKYSELAAAQRTLIEQTQPMIERQLNRRERAEARGVADSQDTIATDITQLATDHQSISQTPVFELAHRRMIELSDRVAEALRSGAPSQRDLGSQDSIASMLEQLAASLTSDPDQGEGFEKDSASSQGSGSPGSASGEEPSAIPPLAELMVLRMLQDQAARLTEQASDSDDATDLDHAVNLQREVSEHAQSLLDKLKGDLPDANEPETLNPQPSADEQDGEQSDEARSGGPDAGEGGSP